MSSGAQPVNFEQARTNMIEQQIRPWDVLDQRVLNALAAVPREKFLPQAYDGLAYSDTRIPLANDRTSLNPNIEARLLQAAVLESDDRALIIGSGSGYIAACAAKMCKHVESIDTSELTNNAAQENAASCGIDNTNVDDCRTCIFGSHDVRDQPLEANGDQKTVCICHIGARRIPDSL